MGHPALSYRNLGFERDADVGGVSLRETAAEAEPLYGEKQKPNPELALGKILVLEKSRC